MAYWRRMALGLVMTGALVAGPLVSSASAAAPASASHPITMTGTWNLAYHFVDRSPGVTLITFASNGTFAEGGETGTWALHRTSLTFTFSACAQATYSGTYFASPPHFKGTMATSPKCGTVYRGTWNMTPDA